MTSVNYETILTNLIDGVMTITMNRPDRLNAWTFKMGAEMQQAIEAGNASEDVDVFIITGAGRGFCAGADIKDLFQQQANSSESQDNESPRDWVGLVRNAKPIIAAVNGAAVGVGLTQILPCDFIMAAPEAKFSARFIKMGLVPELASSFYIAARTGFGQANRLMLTGETISAERALTIGLVDEMVEDASLLLTRAEELAQAMGNNPQQALRMVKTLITQNVAATDVTEIQTRELKALQICYDSPEHKEAINAFIEKRSPDFKRARTEDGAA